MDNKKILIVNLSKGKTGDLNSRLLGMIFVMKFQAAALSRADIPESERQDFCLYVDEFQNFSTDSFATIMSEARKYRLNLVVANQFTTQLTEEIRDAVFGNIGTTVCFRIGQNDLDVLSRYFQPMFDGDDLLRIPNWNMVVRTLIGGVPTQPFSMAGAPSLGTPNKDLGDALKQLSAAKYARPRQVVANEIFARMKTEEPAVPAGSARAGFGQQMPAGTPTAATRPATPGNKSFLDQWLEKRKKTVQSGATAQQSPKAQHQSAITQQTTVPPVQKTDDTQSQLADVPENAQVTHHRKTSTSHPQGELKISKHHNAQHHNNQEDSVVIDRENGNRS